MKKLYTLEIEATGRTGDAALQEACVNTIEAAVQSLPFAVASVTVTLKLTPAPAATPAPPAKV